jgi:cell division protein FtsB
MVDNLKLQLSDKDKENALLKEKITELRKNNTFLQSQVTASRVEQDMNDSRSKKDKSFS